MTSELVDRSRGPRAGEPRLLHRQCWRSMIAPLMSKRLACLTCAAAVLVWTPAGFAQRADTVAMVQEADAPPPQASKRASQQVTGKVVDRDGKPVDRAEVRFDGPKKETVWTDGQGAFSFTGPAGDYVVTVKASDRQQNFNVKIEGNQLKPSTLIIEPEPLI